MSARTFVLYSRDVCLCVCFYVIVCVGEGRGRTIGGEVGRLIC